MSCAAAIDGIRTVIAAALPPELDDANVVIGHPGAQEDYTFAITIFLLQLRDHAAWRTARPGNVGHQSLEADLLVASHAPPERWFDGIRLLEAACEAIRANPHLEGVMTRDTAELQLHSATVDEMTGVWRALGTPMQPSVLCRVRVVLAGPRSF